MGHWVIVSLADAGSDAVEVELEEDGTLLMTNLRSQFANATGLRYRNEATGAYGGIKPVDGKLYAPDGGWGTRIYTGMCKTVRVHITLCSLLKCT